VRDATKALADIAATLKTVRDAGASAGEQMAFLNMSLSALTVTLGRDLRGAEKETVSLMLRQIDLQKQREQIVRQAAESEAEARRRGGLNRALTPGQQAALDVQKIREQRDEQLAQIQEQEDLLRAQLEGRAELFDLDLDRNGLLAKQLELERQTTAEIVARIEQQKDFFRQLSAGLIPSLPYGLIPGGSSNFNWNIDGATIQIVLPEGTTFTPETAAQIVRDGLLQIGNLQQVGI